MDSKLENLTSADINRELTTNNNRMQEVKKSSFRQFASIQWIILILFFSLSCAQSEERYNILWLVTEDMGMYIPPFGDSTIQTPNISRLAQEGIVFTNLHSPSGVCAPSRASIATGLYPSSFGANHMRTHSDTKFTGLPKYEAMPGPEVKMVSELLRREGYYCTNNYKEDYQFKAPKTAWDESSPYAHWRNRKKDQPFYAIFNFNETHESGLFEPYRFKSKETRYYHLGDRSYTWKGMGRSEDFIPVHVAKDTEFKIPPYLPDTDTVRRDMWKMYNNIAEMDRQLGEVLKQLEEDGLLEKTIIFFYADHGGPLPRQKRMMYESGLKVPMIIRLPNQKNRAKRDDQLISFLDFAPTLLSLAGVKPPDYLHGQAFLGKYKAQEKRAFLHAASGRFDKHTDAIRATMNGRFKYIRNYRPWQGYYLPLEYRERIPTMQELLRLRDASKLTKEQSKWFRESKPEEELFDLLADPHELNNLADDPAYREELRKLSKEMDRWLEKINDDPSLPEAELIQQLWKGENQQPKTAPPSINESNDKIEITCATKGASIAYKIESSNGQEDRSWIIYEEPISKEDNQVLLIQSHRIGFKPSEIVTIE
ncbi:MAG: sulfatase [Bacteroidota bacterium]